MPAWRIAIQYRSSWYGVAISTDEILATTGKALAIEPNLPEAHAARGVALLNAGRRAEAVSAFEQALTLDPNCHEANYYYARFCYTEGDFNRAAKHYIRALEIQPNDYKSPLLLHGVLELLGRYAERTKIRTAWNQEGRGSAKAGIRKMPIRQRWALACWRLSANTNGQRSG